MTEGAGPLRTVKSDGQVDERTSMVVNSVSQPIINKWCQKKQNITFQVFSVMSNSTPVISAQVFVTRDPNDFF